MVTTCRPVSIQFKSFFFSFSKGSDNANKLAKVPSTRNFQHLLTKIGRVTRLIEKKRGFGV